MKAIKLVALLLTVLTLSLTIIGTYAFNTSLKKLTCETFKISINKTAGKLNLLEFDGSNLLTSKLKNIGDNEFIPITDKNGREVTINANDPTFESNFFNLLHYTYNRSIESQNLKNVVISMAYAENNNKKRVVYARFYDDPERHDSDVITNDKRISNLDINLKEIVIFMDNYTVVKFSWADGNVKMTSQKVFNPDTDDMSKYIYLNDYDSCYGVNINTGRGHILMNPGNQKLVVDGKKTTFPYSPEMHNGYIAYPEYYLMILINGVSGMNGIHDCSRLVSGGIGFKPRLINLIYNSNNDYAIVDGVKVKLDFVPYTKDNQTMVPMKQYCELFKARYHYRSVDDSILIERYFHWF